jgi:hypothetical protein
VTLGVNSRFETSDVKISVISSINSRGELADAESAFPGASRQAGTHLVQLFTVSNTSENAEHNRE